MQEVSRVHFDDELPYSEQSLRRSCRRLYGHVFEMTKHRPFVERGALQRSLSNLPKALHSTNAEHTQHLETVQKSFLPSYAAREQQKERWVEPASTLRLPTRRCASEITLNGNSRSCTLPAQPYSWDLRFDYPTSTDQSSAPPLSRRRSFSSLPRGHADETNRWRQAVVTSTKEYCSRRDRACRRTLSGYWTSAEDAAFRSSNPFDAYTITPVGPMHQNSLQRKQCSLCHRSELSNWSAAVPLQGTLKPSSRGFDNWNDGVSFRAESEGKVSLPSDELFGKPVRSTEYPLSNQSSVPNVSQNYETNEAFQMSPRAIDDKSQYDNNSEKNINDKMFGTIQHFQDPFLLAKFSSVTNNGDTQAVSLAKDIDGKINNISRRNSSQDDSDSTCYSSANEEVVPTPVIGRREERSMVKHYGPDRKLVYKSDSAIHISARRSVVKKMSILQKACLAARSVKQTLRRAFSQDHIKSKNFDSSFSFRKSFKKRKTNRENQDTEINVSGQLLKVHEDGSLLVELKKSSAGTVGFFVAQGKLKNHKGVFVCRMINMNVRTSLSGLIEIGDEILQVDGISVSSEEVSKVNTMLASKTLILLTILPYTCRNESFTK